MGDESAPDLSIADYVEVYQIGNYPQQGHQELIRVGNNKCSHVHNMYIMRQNTHTCTYLNTSDFSLWTKGAYLDRQKCLFKQGGRKLWEGERTKGERGREIL